MSEHILRLNAVETWISQYHILQGVDLNVARGKVTMLLGRNGAGKTTTMRTIMGHWKPGKGSVQFDGEEIGGKSTPEIARRDIAYVPESMGIFSDLTVEENLILAARKGEMDKERLAWIYDLFPAMQKFWRWPAGNLSGGQKQMLSISRAVIEPRKLILVDEPSKGLAPAIIDNLIRAFDELKRETSILMVEQNFHMAKSLGDHVAVMDDGRIVHNGTMEELGRDESLQQQLLGLSMEAHQ